MTAIRVTGDTPDLELAGLDGDAGADVVVTLRQGERPAEARAWLLWRADCTIARDGDVPWRRAPWPVRDELFDAPEPPGAGRVLCLVDTHLAKGSERSAVDALASRGIDAAAGAQLDRASIEAADVVVLDCAGGSLPAAGMAPPAMGRLVVTVGCSTAFGLLPGIDHLAARDAPEAAALVDAVLSQWDAFAPMRRLGRLAAERHRAPAVYERLLADLALEGLLPE
jgi:hypothetical protein